jgi:hypothetical protein
MPDGTLEQFTNAIQPVLINRCGGCHGRNSQSAFQLFRLPVNQSLPRRFTQRNLHAIMSVIDTEHIDRSPLIVMARTAHGGKEEPVFGQRDTAHLDRLTNWVYQVANRQRPKQPDAGRPPADATRRPGRHTVPSAHRDFDDASPLLRQPDPHRTDPPAARPPVANRASVSVPSNLPSDPFDPEIFNQRYWKR